MGKIIPGIVIGLAAFLTACAVGPDYQRPCAPVPIAFKEVSKDWQAAKPQDACDRGEWWKIFHDAELDCLENKVNVTNQTLSATYSQYLQAVALVDQARASFYPNLSATLSVTRQKAASLTSTTTTGVDTTTIVTPRGAGNGPNTTESFQAVASWVPDLWGSVRRTVEANCAAAQATAAQVALAQLSVQAQLATYYFGVRGLDWDQKLLDDTVKNYRKSLKIVENRYASGTAQRSDVLQAKAQLESAEAQAINNGILRAQYEHAIAMLIGAPPANFCMPVKLSGLFIPSIPISIPSIILQRRPDIASAERLVAQANAQIGVAIAAYFPTLTLSATGNAAGVGSFGQFLSAPILGWSVGPQLAQLIYDGGFRAAGVRAARANYWSTVATYRQTVLAAFQNVEDNLVSLRLLNQQAATLHKAADDASAAVKLITNQYQAGTVAYANVITSQTTAYNAQKAALDVDYLQVAAAVGLIQALGGCW